MWNIEFSVVFSDTELNPLYILFTFHNFFIKILNILFLSAIIIISDSELNELIPFNK